MERYIYAVRKGRNPGIYTNWEDYYEQISGLDSTEAKSFMYHSDLEEEDEELPYSRKWAMKKAEHYLQKKFIADSMNEELHRRLWLNDDLRMGTPWLDMLLFLVGRAAPRISGGKYTGRYFVTSIYCLILYFVMQTDKVLDEVITYHNKTIKTPMSKEGMDEWYEFVHYEIERSDEFINLRERFKKNGMGTLDINDIYHRNIEFAANHSLLSESVSFKCMREFILSGQHDLVDVYNELVSNIVYRNDLWAVNGHYHNPDLYTALDAPVVDNSLKEMLCVSRELDRQLKEAVMGQDDAIEKLEKAYFHNEKAVIGMKKRTGPRSVYLFAGPPGVGKTMTAKTFANALGISCRKFDMSGYASSAALDELTGISSFYRASKPGVLTGYVNAHPRSILIFDEIEKANGAVIRMFLQILEDGVCFDRYYDREISFKDCIIIMTTNAGRKVYQDSAYQNLSRLPERILIDALEKDINPATKEPYFPKEIVSRLSSHTIILFDRMDADIIRQIIGRDIDRQLKTTKQNCGIDISAGSEILADVVLYSIGGGGDARNASKLAGKLIDNELYGIMHMAGSYADKLKYVEWIADFSTADGETRRIFMDEDGAEYMYKRHLVLKFDTDRNICQDGETGEIVFCNFRLEVAVDAEDRAAIVAEDIRPDKTWDDIYVSEDVRRELEYFISYLSHPKKYARTKARAPRGALMYGPPGTGKTSLAKVVAAESKVNFISVSADEMISGGPGKVHDIFRMARKYSPTVLFIDEIDAIGVSRSASGTNAALNALLTEMDGFKNEETSTVFVMAATNLPGIDSALARRFDRTFLIDLPDEKGRRWLVEHLLERYRDYFNITEGELDSIATRSKGMSLAELENVVEAAVREAVRKETVVQDSLFDSVFETCNHGESKEHDSLQDLEHTACHEAGHAIVELANGKTPDYISAIARSSMGGYMRTGKLQEHPTKEELLGRICTCMGGRAAEQEFGYGLTPSAAGDLRYATDIAVRMVCEYGMYEDEMGLAVLDSKAYDTDEKAKLLVNRILSQELTKARCIVRENASKVTAIVEALLDSPQKSLNKQELSEIYRRRVEV